RTDERARRRPSTGGDGADRRAAAGRRADGGRRDARPDPGRPVRLAADPAVGRPSRRPRRRRRGADRAADRRALRCPGARARGARRRARPVVTLALSWSGGKDSALALHALRDQGAEPVALLTTVTHGYDRVSMHGVRRTLLRRQADGVGVPLVEVVFPPACTNEVYEERMGHALASPPLRDVQEVAFGDLFLEDVRAYREERL